MPVLKYRPDESSSWQTVGITVDGYTKEETDTLLQNKATILTSGLNIYVSTSGNDTTGDGSQSKPFRTIQKAVDSIPPVLNGKVVKIRVSAGIYDEDVIIAGKAGSFGHRPIQLLGATSVSNATNYKMRSLSVHGTGMGCVCVDGFQFTGPSDGGADVCTYGGASIYVRYCVLDSVSKDGVYVGDRPFSVVVISESTISNKTRTAFLSMCGGLLLVRECTGENNAVVYDAGGGSGFGGIIFNCGKNTVSGTVNETKSYGGQIFK